MLSKSVASLISILLLSTVALAADEIPFKDRLENKNMWEANPIIRVNNYYVTNTEEQSVYEVTISFQTLRKTSQAQLTIGFPRENIQKAWLHTSQGPQEISFNFTNFSPIYTANKNESAVTFEFDQSLEASQEHKITIRYLAPWMFSDICGWPRGAFNRKLPSMDNHTNPATLTLDLKRKDPVESTYMPLSNGKLAIGSYTGEYSAPDAQGYRHLTWVQDQPIHLYSMRIFSAKKPKLNTLCLDATGTQQVPCENAARQIPLLNIGPGTSSSGFAGGFLDLSQRFGAYGFDKLGNVPGGCSHLMEYASIVDKYSIHELAHHWFGNRVLPKSVYDVWISEGLTSYSIAPIYEKGEYYFGDASSMYFAPMNFTTTESGNFGPSYGRSSLMKDIAFSLQYVIDQETTIKQRHQVVDDLLKKLVQTYNFKQLGTEDFLRFLYQNLGSVISKRGYTYNWYKLSTMLNDTKNYWGFYFLENLPQSPQGPAVNGICNRSQRMQNALRTRIPLACEQFDSSDLLKVKYLATREGMTDADFQGLEHLHYLYSSSGFTKDLSIFGDYFSRLQKLGTLEFEKIEKYFAPGILQKLGNLGRVAFLESAPLTFDESDKWWARLYVLTLDKTPVLGLTSTTFSENKELMSLVMNGASLQELPAGVLGPLKKLRNLELTNNLLSNVSNSGINELVTVENIVLFKNQLTELPPLGNLKRLRRLILAKNQFKDFSEKWIQGLDKLERIDLAENPLTDFPEQIFRNYPKLHVNLAKTQIPEARLRQLAELFPERVIGLKPVEATPADIH